MGGRVARRRHGIGMSSCEDRGASTTAEGRGQPHEWLRLLRLSHWPKNAIVFPALVLAGRSGEGPLWVQALWGFAAFCLASSAIYAFNDHRDREDDRRHPRKWHRPLASGRLSARAVLRVAGLLAALGLLAGLAAPWPLRLAGGVALYLLVNLAYSLGLKQFPVLDVTCIAAGFVLRLLAVLGLPGGAADVLLLGSVFALCLFAAVSKRITDAVCVGVSACSIGGPADPSPRGGAGGGSAPVSAAVVTLPWLRGFMVASALLTLGLYGAFLWARAVPCLVPLVTLLPVGYSLVRLARLAISGSSVEPSALLRGEPGLVSAGVIWLALWLWLGIAVG